MGKKLTLTGHALPSVGLCEGWGEVRGQGSQFLDGGIEVGNRRRASAGLAPARAQTAETHAQAVTTAAPKARLSQPTWFPDAIPAKPARKTTPVTVE